MTQSQFILFPDRWAEDLYWGQQLCKPGLQVLLVRESQRPQALMSLCHAWELASGQRADYWIGSLWDVPVVRAALQRLQDEPQTHVLEYLVQQAPANTSRFYHERNLEAWRCFVEMLEPSDELLGLEAWRELTLLCRGTVLEYGQWPGSLTIVTEYSTAPDDSVSVGVPYCYQLVGGLERWPGWLLEHPQVQATVAHYDKRHQKQAPDFELQVAAGWDLQEQLSSNEPEEAVSEPCQPAPLVDPHRIQLWQESRAQHIYSASELELYARSPFAYYCERVLKLDSHVEATWDLNPLETGLVVHRVLERYYQENQLSVAEPNYQRASELIEEEVAATLTEREGVSDFLIERQQAKMVRAIHGVLKKDQADIAEQSSPLMPTYFEWVFGEGEVPPLEIAGHGGQSILMRGKIDRIDVDHDKKTFMVIDYKTGGGKITGADIQHGRSLQLPLYIQAVKQHLLPDYDPIGGMFFSLADMSKKDGLLRLDYIKDYFDISLRSSSLMSPKKWQQVIDDAFALIQNIVQALQAGEFPLCEELCASYCEFQDMCGWNRQ